MINRWTDNLTFDRLMSLNPYWRISMIATVKDRMIQEKAMNHYPNNNEVKAYLVAHCGFAPEQADSAVSLLHNINEKI